MYTHIYIYIYIHTYIHTHSCFYHYDFHYRRYTHGEPEAVGMVAAAGSDGHHGLLHGLSSSNSSSSSSSSRSSSRSSSSSVCYRLCFVADLSLHARGAQGTIAKVSMTPNPNPLLIQTLMLILKLTPTLQPTPALILTPTRFHVSEVWGAR